MNLLDIVGRTPRPAPWAEGDKIPWDEPEFSRRMLREHLSQDHDAASRRLATIERHVAWIHTQVLSGRAARVLDLGCGPGLYTGALCRLGHTCVGIDFAPASIAYARAEAERARLGCTYVQGDLRSADFGYGYDLVMSIYGELNVFRPDDARRILGKAYSALAPGAALLLEVHTFDEVKSLGEQSPAWYSTREGLFSERPHLCLSEGFWDRSARVAVQRYFVVDAATGAVARHASSTQAYSDAEYLELLAAVGFRAVTICPSLVGYAAPPGGLMAIVARR